MTIDAFIDSFVKGDYFILFLVIVLLILLVLVLALVKSREDYKELLTKDIDFKKKEEKEKEPEETTSVSDDDILSELTDLMSKSKEDTVDMDKPIIKDIKSYDDTIRDYEAFEEESAVISADELEQRKQERMDALGSTENQEAIAKYEEEQEKKAIISYEQLVKNASNITLSYTEEEQKSKDAPKVTKIEVKETEVSAPDSYLAEEEFLSILKEFRINLNE